MPDDEDFDDWIDDEEDDADLDELAEHYVTAGCKEFAVALHDLTGLPIVGLCENGKTFVVHYAVEVSEGRVLDARGVRTLDAVVREQMFMDDDLEGSPEEINAFFASWRDWASWKRCEPADVRSEVSAADVQQAGQSAKALGVVPLRLMPAPDDDQASVPGF